MQSKVVFPVHHCIAGVNYARAGCLAGEARLGDSGKHTSCNQKTTGSSASGKGMDQTSQTTEVETATSCCSHIVGRFSGPPDRIYSAQWSVG